MLIYTILITSFVLFGSMVGFDWTVLGAWRNRSRRRRRRKRKRKKKMRKKKEGSEKKDEAYAGVWKSIHSPILTPCSAHSSPLKPHAGWSRGRIPLLLLLQIACSGYLSTSSIGDASPCCRWSVDWGALLALRSARTVYVSVLSNPLMTNSGLRLDDWSMTTRPDIPWNSVFLALSKMTVPFFWDSPAFSVLFKASP